MRCPAVQYQWGKKGRSTDHHILQVVRACCRLFHNGREGDHMLWCPGRLRKVQDGSPSMIDSVNSRILARSRVECNTLTCKGGDMGLPATP